MSFDRLIKGYLNSNTAPAGRTSSLLRKVAAPAAIGLSLGMAAPMAGCGGADQDEAAINSAAEKADYIGKKCSANKDCFPGLHCEGARSCPEGAYCILPPTAGTCLENALCSVDEDCGANQACKVEKASGGCPEGALCILAPTPSENTSGCPEGAICILAPTPDPEGICESKCVTANDCARGEQCMEGLCEMHIYAILAPQ
jgi:hypothetical protein